MTSNAAFADDLARSIFEYFNEKIETDNDYEEVRGWYHFDGEMRYIVHDPKLGRWRSCTDDHTEFLLGNGYPPPDISARTGPEVFALSADDAREVTKKIAQLHMMPRPELPMDIHRSSQTEPFVHDGWLFAWYFFPELKRWVLAPVRRR